MYEPSGADSFGPLFMLFMVGLYLYYSFCQYRISQKTNHPYGWWAFIPLLNVVQLIQMAGRELWWFVLLLVPLANVIFFAMIWIDVAKRIGHSPITGFLTILPFLNFITIGIMAFTGSPTPNRMPPGSRPSPSEQRQPTSVG